MTLPKNPHCALICGRTNCGKTKFILDSLENEYKNNFEKIVIICPTLSNNRTYRDRSWFWNDEDVIPCDLDLENITLNQALSYYRKVFKGLYVLFIIDDCSALQEIKYRRETCELTKLAYSGRHDNHSCWLLTQKYNNVLKDFREQTQFVVLFYCKDKTSFDQCLNENDGVPVEEIANIKTHLKNVPYSKLIIKTDPPIWWKLL